MKKTFYTLKNTSGSEGTYFIDGDYKTLFPGQELTLEKPPVNKTANIKLVVFRKEIKNTVPLNLKSKKVETQKEVHQSAKPVATENKGV